MDTAPLKSFATSARIELIREVGARITAVLAPGSPERVEQPRAVTALERTIAAGGGGDNGRAHVADKVAYTWFNRIIALRFMDANGYTGIGVVSPATDQVGQPEVLAAAKRGQIDSDVVKGANVATITGLLNGASQPRPGVDAQAEAYALLLADYCRYWNRTMPFMFERKGDYTELLIPANLLAEGSVLNRSVKVLTEEVCQDVEVIGWLYQFYISERKDEVFAGFKKNKKAGADEIPAATQLFTPHWIVRYLVENSVGRLWMLNHPESRLIDQMEYYIAPVDEETDFLKITRPEELTVIDPACGSGHMLTYAFDLLYAIYEEDGYTPSQIPGLILTHNLYGTEIDPRAGALAAFALTMKAAAKRKLFLKNPVEPNISVLDPISFSVDELSYLVTIDGDRHAEEAFWNQFAEADTVGALVQPDPRLITRLTQHVETLEDGVDLLRADTISWSKRVLRQAGLLAARYAVAVQNPPYMGGANMGAVLSAYVAANFKAYKADLFSAFIARTFALVRPRGFVGVMSPNVWMYIAAHEKLRRRLLHDGSLSSLVELPLGGFRGATVQVCAFVFAPSPNAVKSATFISLVAEPLVEVLSGHALAVARSADAGNVFTLRPSALSVIPSAPVAYWLPDEAIRAYSEFDSLGDHSYGQPGLQTSDNARFIRFWYEVGVSRTNFGAESSPAALESGATWFPLVKGGDFRKWFGNLETVVDWESDGARIKESINSKYPYLKGNIDYVVKDRGYFFRPSLTYNKITSGRFTARFAPAGTIFDVAGSAVFPHDEPLLALAVLGSTTGEFFIRAQNPTLNVQSGDVARLPYPASLLKDRSALLAPLVSEAIELSERDWNSVETAWGFQTLPVLGVGSTGEPLALRLASALQAHSRDRERLAQLETEINTQVANVYGLTDAVPVAVHADEVTLRDFNVRASATDLVSYAIGCMFGRYSLDEPGLIVADPGATLQDYLAKVPTPTFTPDADNVIPIVDGDWFEDDIVARFRQFLRVAFGEQHFEENLQFVTQSLGVKSLRDYFVKSFYKDHVQRYKKRPIYWLFSSPKGSFNALIYMHRYTPSTVSTVLTYLREYVTKLESALRQAERAGNVKEADRLRRILVELNEYEHDTLFPKASENVVIDLDDGVKANYPKFGAALKKIPGLEAASD